MGSNASEDNIWASTRVHHANPCGDKHLGVPAEHAARRVAHDVEHVERNTNADVANCAACHGDGRLTSISRGRRLDGDAIFRGDSHHLLDFRHALRGGRIQFGKHLIEAAARRTQDQHTCRLVADIAEGVAPSAGAEKETAGPDAPYPSRLESLLLSLWRKSTPRSGPVGPGSILMRY
jgi:hypothetical protein